MHLINITYVNSVNGREVVIGEEAKRCSLWNLTALFLPSSSHLGAIAFRKIIFKKIKINKNNTFV